MTATASRADPADAIIVIPPVQKRQSLFELTSEYVALAEAITDAVDETGTIPNDLAARADAIEGKLSDKFDSCYKMLRTFETEAAAADEELDRLNRLVSARRKRVDWMKKYILDSMLAAGIKKHEGKTCTMRVQKNSQPSVRLEGEAIPVQFMRVKTVCELDAKEVVSAHKAGELLPPNVLVIEGHHLRTVVPK